MFELSRTAIPVPQQQQHPFSRSNSNQQAIAATVPYGAVPFACSSSVSSTSVSHKKNDDDNNNVGNLKDGKSSSSSPFKAAAPLSSGLSGAATVPTNHSKPDSLAAHKAPAAAEPANPTSQTFKYCSFCERSVLTIVELHPSIWCFVATIILFLIFGWISFCLLPFIWPLLQTVKHYCPICREVLEKKSRVSCASLRGEVVTLRIGSCALVLSSYYVLVCGFMMVLICSILGIRWYLNLYGIPDIPKGESIDSSWSDFLAECGVRSFLGNPVRAEKNFEEHFMDKTVRWEGRMHHIQEGIFGKHVMYLDMNPRQYQRSDLRDLSLIFGKSLFKKAAEVETGDQVSVELTLIEFGKRGRPNLGFLWDFNITAKAADVPQQTLPENRFLVVRNQLSRPPIDFLNLIKILSSEAQQQFNKGPQQLPDGTIRMIFPMDDGMPMFRVISKTTSSDEKTQEAHDSDDSHDDDSNDDDHHHHSFHIGDHSDDNYRQHSGGIDELKDGQLEGRMGTGNEAAVPVAVGQETEVRKTAIAVPAAAVPAAVVPAAVPAAAGHEAEAVKKGVVDGGK